jgi:hypothetical protein
MRQFFFATTTCVCGQPLWRHVHEGLHDKFVWIHPGEKRVSSFDAEARVFEECSNLFHSPFFAGTIFWGGRPKKDIIRTINVTAECQMNCIGHHPLVTLGTKELHSAWGYQGKQQGWIGWRSRTKCISLYAPFLGKKAISPSNTRTLAEGLTNRTFFIHAEDKFAWNSSTDL